MAEPQIPWRELVAVLHRRRRMIIQVFLAGSITVALGVWMSGPKYRAVATLMLTSDRARVAVSPDADTRPLIDSVTELDLNSEVALLESEALVREVLEPYWVEDEEEDKPGLKSRVFAFLSLPVRLPLILYGWLHGISPRSGLDLWVADVASDIGIGIVGHSNLIQVVYESSRPKWAAEFVNAFTAKHIERRAKLSQQSEAKQFYESQRQLLAEKAAQATAALDEFYKREGMDAMSADQRRALRDRLQELQITLANSETELAEGSARMQFLANEIKNYPKNISTESKIAQNQQYIKPKILELELLRTELLSKYAPGSVKVRDLDRQIAEARRLMMSDRETLAETTNAINPAYQNIEVDLAQTKAQMAAVQARVEALRAQIGGYKAQVARLDSIGTEQERLEQDVAGAKEAFLTYSKKAEEARFSSALDESTFVDVAVVEPAKVPTAPERSKKLRSLMMGCIASLITGIGLAFLRDRLDPAVKSAAEAQGVTGLPILAEVR
jgi:polysaccharide biosynthesis transport protein